ncbi:MAG: hypothetical protein FWE67_03965 [Planctomycetaceae bacterium]|nr:hypothetical protein [Planctomycetaceae bacterium]
MSEFITIKNDHDIQQLFDKVHYFHDSIIRQCMTQSIGYVDSLFGMYGDVEPFNAKIFIQSQFSESPCIEIYLYRVSKLLLKDVFISEASGKTKDQRIFISFSCSSEQDIQFNNFDIIAEDMKYRILDQSFLGERLIF